MRDVEQGRGRLLAGVWVRVLGLRPFMAWFCCGVLACVSGAALAAVGRTEGSAATSQIGAATYSIPLQLPPGTQGLTPRLSLSYDHNTGNGILGMGWSIGGLSVIKRCDRTFAQDGESRAASLAVDDGYCLDAQRLRRTGGTYGLAGSSYQTEIESFARVTAQGTAGNGPAFWKVETKDGLILEYGGSVDSRIETVGAATARLWAINKISDRAGNQIVFEYIDDTANGSYRPSAVIYGSNTAAGVSAHTRVDFVYEVRVDPILKFRYGLNGTLIQGQLNEFNRLDRINIVHAGSTVRTVDLTYEATGGAGQRSRLSSIRECVGMDCLAATNLQWLTGSVGWTTELSGAAGSVNGVLVGDINGDGKDDLVYSSHPTSGSGVWEFMLGTDTGLSNAFATSIANSNYTEAQLIEWDGDGKLDVLVPCSGTGTWCVLQATGSGFAAPLNTGSSSTGSADRVLAADIDGDGRDDLVRADLSRLRLRLREASGFGVETIAWTSGIPNSLIDTPQFIEMKELKRRGGHRRVDIDGDGREDFFLKMQRIINFSQPPEIYFNSFFGNGSTIVGYKETVLTALPNAAGDFNNDGLTDIVVRTNTVFVTIAGQGRRLSGNFGGPSSAGTFAPVLTDYDGDGKDDLLIPKNTPASWHLARSTGNAFEALVDLGLSAATSTSGKNFAVDFNGDGLADLGRTDGTLAKLRLHAGVFPDLLDRVTDGYGNYADFSYQSIATDSGGCYSRNTDAPAYPRRGFRGPLYVVCSSAASNGIGGSYTVNHSYFNANADNLGRGFLGFESKLSLDNRTGLSAYEYFNTIFPYIGTLQTVEVFQPGGVRLAFRQTVWAQHQYGSGFETRSLPYVSSSVGREYEVGGAFNGQLIRTVSTTNTVDFGTGTAADSTTTVTEGINANGLNAGQSYTFQTSVPELYTDSTNWCLGRPSKVQQINSHPLHGGAIQTRTVETTWDGPLCRPTQSVIEPGHPTREVTTDLGYDTFGNLEVQTVTPKDESERITRFGWGTDGRFPRTLTNALSQVTTLDWFTGLGLLKSATDPNGLTGSNTYDNFGRLATQTQPDGTSTLIEYVPCDSDCTGFANTHHKIRTTLRDTAAATIAQRFTLVDALDRPRRNSSYALEGGLINQLTEYDLLGRVARSSVPYFSLIGTPVWTSFTYDVLDRLRQSARERTSDTDASQALTTIDFEGLTVSTVDPLGTTRLDTLDALGQRVRAVLASGTVDESRSSYDYDAFGSLVRTTDGEGNQILIAYDVRGFKVSASDPDLGTWTYDYYALGELKRQTDAKSQDTAFTYDKLSRLLTRTEPADSGSGMQTTTLTWGSSAGAFNIGQLQSITVGGYSESYAYDNRSRLASTTVVAEGASYVLGQSYNATTGFLESITYPASTGALPFKVKYEYETANKSGLLQRVKDYNASTVFWQAVSSNALGQYQDVTLGNGLQTLTAFDSITGAANRIETGPSGGHARQDLLYSWDKLGNLSSRQDLNISKTETFAYDNLYRLIEAHVSGTTALTVSYDQLGNITSKSDLGSYSYHPTRKHAVSSAGPLAFTYDANGNLQTQVGGGLNATVQWTAYNLPKLISDVSGFSSSFLYGPDRQRYKQVAMSPGISEATVYVKGLFEKLIRASGVEYKHSVFGPEGVIAVHNRKSSGVNETLYLLQDHLGSTDVITNSSGASLLKLSYGPFGERRNGTTWSGPAPLPDYTTLSNTTRLGFTGHEYLDNLDLVHMNGRVYHPRIARFGSADPFVQEPFNPQSLNRYSYVFNNPLSFTDPSGFNTDDPDGPEPPMERPRLCISCPGGSIPGDVVREREGEFFGPQFRGQPTFSSTPYVNTLKGRSVGVVSGPLDPSSSSVGGKARVDARACIRFGTCQPIQPIPRDFTLGLIDVPIGLVGLLTLSDISGEDVRFVLGLEPANTASKDYQDGFVTGVILTAGLGRLAAVRAPGVPASERFFIENGVRRSLAVREAGLTEIPATIFRPGQAPVNTTLRLEQLLSPKTTVTADARFLRIQPPIQTPIQVQPLGLPGQLPSIPISQVTIVP